MQIPFGWCLSLNKTYVVMNSEVINKGFVQVNPIMCTETITAVFHKVW